MWRNKGDLPAENLYKLPAKLAQIILLLEQELKENPLPTLPV